MIDTSVLVAGLVEAHEFHDRARPHVVAASTGTVPGIVVAEAWAVLRAGPFNLDVDTVQQALAPWADVERLAVTPADAYRTVLRNGSAWQLGGNVHDLLIALTCRSHGLELATLDRRQAHLARRHLGLEVTLLLDA
ncbi:type II toxin-antitoxin system VapC family toxin [Salsipaludibacter albus]|uniref:type II toxin-antitoxin system VapC family toxin n=1 Tax=Salsipaludibacter albus TaxID=2849650 RepID=UPI001EE3EF46|nr:PIN domain-containing protein [Salsipaludibacter albus]